MGSSGRRTVDSTVAQEGLEVVEDAVDQEVGGIVEEVAAAIVVFALEVEEEQRVVAW